MIAVDTSALVAIVLEEPEADQFLSMMRSQVSKIGGSTLAEAKIVTESKGGARGLTVLGAILDLPTVMVEPFAEKHATAAHEAHRRFGKGRGHPAKLNICDCFSYAVAACDDLPLLFKGDDFTHTDIRPAYLP